jgi:MFS family permease
MFGSFLAIPQFAQAAERTGYGFGLSATAAGFLLLPVAIGQLLAGIYAGRVAVRFGSRTVLGAGALLLAATFTTMALAHQHPWQFVAAGVVFGNGLTLCLASMANVMITSVAQSEVGIATGINTVTRTVGGSVGAAIAASLLATHTLPGTELPTEGAYTAVFVCSAAAALVAFAASLLVPRTRRRAPTTPEPAAQPGHT